MTGTEMNLIGGERLAGSGEAFPVLDPATGREVTRYRLGTSADVDDAVTNARQAFGSWSRTTPGERSGLLARLAVELGSRAAELAEVETAGVASSEKSAIDWLCNPANEWDIAIVDLTLERGGSGFGVLSAVRDRKPGRKVVVLTGTANPDVRRQCETLGSDRVFDKSIETDALIEYCQSLPGPSRG